MSEIVAVSTDESDRAARVNEQSAETVQLGFVAPIGALRQGDFLTGEHRYRGPGEQEPYRETRAVRTR